MGLAQGNGNFIPPDRLKKILSSGSNVHVPEIIRFFGGQAGGKYRGFQFFMEKILENQRMLEGEFGGKVIFTFPDTALLQTDLFEEFVENKRLREAIAPDMDDIEVRAEFLKGKFAEARRELFRKLLSMPEFQGPIAVRSSAPEEDGERSSFAGIFSSVFLPNCHPDPEVRLMQFEAAVKLVFASAFSEDARAYRKMSGMVGGLEKMACLVQSVAGRQWGNLYYPEISFAAFKFNDYATNGIDPDDGFIRMAFGLGPGVVDNQGRTAVRVNMGKPLPIAGMNGTKLQLDYAPQHFWALVLDQTDA